MRIGIVDEGEARGARRWMAVPGGETLRAGRWSARQRVEMALLMQAVEDVAKAYRRGVRANDGFPLEAQPFLVLAAWCLVMFLLTSDLLTRRG